MSNADIRWMIRRDMQSVLEIEHDSFEYPWTEDEFIRCLRTRDCIGMAALIEEAVAGYMIYELHPNRIQVLTLAVAPKHRRSGVGTAMVEMLKSCLAYQRRNRISLIVQESNLPAQLFFRSLGFKVKAIYKDQYDHGRNEDAYAMTYRRAETLSAPE